MTSDPLVVCALLLCTAASADDALVLLHQLPPIKDHESQAIEHYNKAHALCETAIATSIRKIQLEQINRSEQPRILRWLMEWFGPLFQAVEVITYDSCIDEYKLALNLDPKFPEAHFNIGWAYLHKTRDPSDVDGANKANEVKSVFTHFRSYTKYAKKNSHSDRVRRLLKVKKNAS